MDSALLETVWIPFNTSLPNKSIITNAEVVSFIGLKFSTLIAGLGYSIMVLLPSLSKPFDKMRESFPVPEPPFPPEPCGGTMKQGSVVLAL